MSKDYYETLGVKKDANKADIKKAYRTAAKQHHPDKGGDSKKFKAVNQAYETLSDDTKKSQYDRFGSAGPQGGFGGGPQGGGFDFSGFQGGGTQHVNFEDIGDIFGSFFGGGFGGNPNQPRRGSDLEVEVTLDFDQSIKGLTKKFKSDLSAEKTVEVKIPAGIGHGDTLRMSGNGESGKNGGPAGDLYVHIRVHPSKKFHRRGLDIITELDMPIFQALLGDTVTIETIHGKVDIKIPELTRDEQLVRIKGKGVTKGPQTGDHIVKVQHKMPKKIGKKLKELLEQAQKEG